MATGSTIPARREAAAAQFGIVNGAAGDDSLPGTDFPDSILGRSGDDTIRGGAGGDTLSGGPGDDSQLGKVMSWAAYREMGFNQFSLLRTN
jgi:RTX calcium-binding nonapeptide repeat (4 copies)